MTSSRAVSTSSNSANPLNQPIERLVRPAAAKKFMRLGITDGWSLLYHLPRRWYQRGELTPLNEIQIGNHVTVAGIISNVQGYQNPAGTSRIVATLSDGNSTIEATYFVRKRYLYEYYQRRLSPGEWVVMSGRASLYRNRPQLVHPEFLDLEQDADNTAVTTLTEKVRAPIPIYPATANLPSWRIHALTNTLLSQLTDVDVPELIPEVARHENQLLSRLAALRAIHNPQTVSDTQAALRTLKFEEALILQLVIARARQRTAERGAITIANAHELAQPFIAALPFALRPAQTRALDTILAQLSGAQTTAPLQALLQADVGAGKTIVAGISAATVVAAGYQVAFLAPTEVLANQHAQTLRTQLGIEVALLTGSTPLAQRRELTRKIIAGEPLLVVGTHALLNIKIPRLALAIIDEQHRFGVAQRDHLRNLNEHPAHLLVMTATPIPRSLAMTVFGDLDALTMNGPGARTGKVETYLVPASNRAWNARTWARLQEEAANNGRVFIVVPRVEDDPKADLASLNETIDEVARYLPREQIASIYGALPAAEKAQQIERFRDGSAPVLVATTVIEVGIDVPNATMMIIRDADRFGLAQLHQLRGRVGRGGQDGLCLAQTAAQPGTSAWERLCAFQTTTDGFELAQLDLQQRSSGDLAAANQSGRSQLLIDPINDQALIAAARDLAQKIIAEDPHLDAHPQLAAELARRLDSEQQERLQQS